MKNTIKWIAGVLFILGGLGSMTSGGLGIIGGLFLISAGLVCLPPFLKLIEDRLQTPIKTPIKYILVIGLWLVGAAIIPKDFASQTKSSSSTKNDTKKEPSKEETISTESVTNWSYDSTEDMGTVIRFAITQSLNTVDFKFPYQGEQHATLQLELPKKYVTLRIEKGQFVDHILGGSCVVQFDDKVAENYSFAGSADQDATVIFLQDYNRFVANLRHAKTIRMKAVIYQEGAPIFTFSTEGLKWK